MKAGAQTSTRAIKAIGNHLQTERLRIDRVCCSGVGRMIDSSNKGQTGQTVLTSPQQPQNMCAKRNRQVGPGKVKNSTDLGSALDLVECNVTGGGDETFKLPIHGSINRSWYF